MWNPFEFFHKSMEAFQRTQDEALKMLSPTPVEEFTVCDGDEFKIFVEGSWISMDEFITRYKHLRNLCSKSSLR